MWYTPLCPAPRPVAPQSHISWVFPESWLQRRDVMTVRWWTWPRTLQHHPWHLPPVLWPGTVCLMWSGSPYDGRRAVDLRETLYAVCKKVSGTRHPPTVMVIILIVKVHSRCHQWATIRRLVFPTDINMWYNVSIVTSCRHVWYLIWDAVYRICASMTDGEAALHQANYTLASWARPQIERSTNILRKFYNIPKGPLLDPSTWTKCQLGLSHYH